MSHPHRSRKESRILKQIFRRLLLRLIHFMGAINLLAARCTRGKPSHPPRVLIIRPDHIGDILLTTPALHALKTTPGNVHITMIVGPWSKAVVERNPYVDRLITVSFPGIQKHKGKRLQSHRALFLLALRLRKEKYDLAINLRPGFWWGALLAYIAAVPHRVGYDARPANLFLSQFLSLLPVEHSAASNLRLVSFGMQQLGLPPLDEPYKPEYYPAQFEPTDEEDVWISKRFYENAIDPSAYLVVIHPGTAIPGKLWCEASWSHCADELLTLAPNVQLVFSGSPAERPLLERIAQGMAGTSQAPLLITDMTLGQLAALMSRADLVLGVDSGPLHLAAVRGRPTVQLFGPTDARIFGPWDTRASHTIIAATVHCQDCPGIPCGRFYFNAEDVESHPCTRLIPVKRVENAIMQIKEQLQTI